MKKYIFPIICLLILGIAITSFYFIVLRPFPIKKQQNHNTHQENKEKKFKILDKSIFGFRLGENLKDIEKRCGHKLSEYEDSWFFRDRPSLNSQIKTYSIYMKHSVIKRYWLVFFNNQLFSINLDFTDPSFSNYNAIVKEIKANYKIIKEKNYQDDLTTNASTIFIVLLKHKKIKITVSHFITRYEHLPIPEMLSITYIYQEIPEFLITKKEKRDKIKDNL